MIKEYRTIQEVAAPLMVVDQVQGVTYDELAEIELTDGTIRRCQGAGGRRRPAPLCSCSIPPRGINLAQSKVRFLGHPAAAGRVSGDMLGRVFDGMGQPIDGGPEILAEEYRDINGLPMNPAARNYPNEFIQTGSFRHRRSEHPGPRPEAADLLRLRSAPRAAGRPDCPSGQGARTTPAASPSCLPPSASPLRSPSTSSHEFRRTGAIDRTVLFTNLA